jgi:transposase
MRPHGSPKTLEHRRQHAVKLLEQGLTLSEVAARTGASVSSVFRWREAFSEGGRAALAPKPVPGRPAKLEEDQVKQLLAILLRGAMAYGFPNDLWTLKRIASAIRREFRVRMHPGHIWKLLRGKGWSCQVPERRAIQRDEEGIERWKQKKWPGIKKKPKTWCPPRFPR